MRRQFITLVGNGATAWPIAARAVPDLALMLMLMLTALVSEPGSATAQGGPTSIKRIGVLSAFGCPVATDSPFSRRLAELGWVEGKNFIYDCVFPVGGRLDQVEQLAAELVARRPDVISTGGGVPFVRALKRATTTIPIVMLGTNDPVRAGLVTNLARPEANVTGFAWFGWDIMPKRVELLKEVLPQMQRLAIIFSAHGDPKVIESLEVNAAIAAKQFGLSFQIFLPAIPEDYDKIFSQLSDQHFDAAYIQGNPLGAQNFKRIVELALRYRVPTMGDDATAARGGLLLGYGGDFATVAVIRSTDYVDKILRGAKPSELPIELPTKLDLAINLKTARALSVTVPPATLARADEVIE
jgi:putative tryptophan/tyrosine transport system substrate-binding protein